jgi:hypothetical protein
VAWWVIFPNSTKLEFSKYPLRCSMDLVDMGAKSTFFADLEFAELECLARKIRRKAIFLIWNRVELYLVL